MIKVVNRFMHGISDRTTHHKQQEDFLVCACMVMYGDLEFEACIDDLLSRLSDKNHHKTQAEREIFAQ